MRNDEGGAALSQAIEALLKPCFRGDVQRAGSLVEQQDRRVLQQGAGNRDALAFTPR